MEVVIMTIYNEFSLPHLIYIAYTLFMCVCARNSIQTPPLGMVPRVYHVYHSSQSQVTSPYLYVYILYAWSNGNEASYSKSSMA